MNFIQFENVTREYPAGKEMIKALDNVDFTINIGQNTNIIRQVDLN